MSRLERNGRGGRRERIALSVLSLLVLAGLLTGYLMLRSQGQQGRLGLISTSQVTINVNGVPNPDTPFPGAEPTQTPSPTPAPAARPSGGRGPALTTEVLGADQQARAGAAAAGIAVPTTAAGGTQPPAAGATATPSNTSTGTGFAPPQIGSIGSNGAGAGGGGPGLPTATSAAPTATPALGQATATPSGPTATAAPPTPVPPTATPEQEGEPAPRFIGALAPTFVDVIGPGAYATDAIIVSNVGQVAFNYSLSMNVSGDAALGSEIRFRIYLRKGSTCDFPGQPPAPGDTLLPLTGDQVGSVLYDGSFTAGNKFGDPTVELASGDRPLGVGQSEVLCFEIFFPWTAGNEFQDRSVTGTLIFTAKSPDH
jgi:hypothetical protein